MTDAWNHEVIRSDPLDRAASAARASYLAAPRTRGMDPLPLWRSVAAAALRVMADEIRRDHKTYGLNGQGIGCLRCIENDGTMADWPCTTIRILDRYVGSDDD